jgi:hypothetical protein
MRSSPPKGFSTPPLKKFFGFRAAQILVIEFGEDLRQYLFELFWRDDIFQPRPVFVVLRGGDEKKIFGPLRVGKLIEIGRGESVGHLPCAIGAEIKENYRVFIANQADWLG